MNPIEQSAQLCELTKKAIAACHDEDWHLAQSLVNQRDRQLDEVLSLKNGLLSGQDLANFRNNLENLSELNNELSQTTLISRNKLLDQQFELGKNVKAIKSYLDHSGK